MMNGYYGGASGGHDGRLAGRLDDEPGRVLVDDRRDQRADWMRGGILPSAMMGGGAGSDLGTVMGILFAADDDRRARVHRVGAMQAPSPSAERMRARLVRH